MRTVLKKRYRIQSICKTGTRMVPDAFSRDRRGRTYSVTLGDSGLPRLLRTPSYYENTVARYQSMQKSWGTGSGPGQPI